MNDNNLSGIIILLFSIFGLIVILKSEIELETKVFPMILIGLLFIGGIVLIVKGFLEGKNGIIPKISWKRVIPIIFILLFYGFMLEYFGFIITTIIFLLTLLLFLGIRQPIKLLGISLFTTFGVYWIFSKLLQVQLP